MSQRMRATVPGRLIGRHSLRRSAAGSLPDSLREEVVVKAPWERDTDRAGQAHPRALLTHARKNELVVVPARHMIEPEASDLRVASDFQDLLQARVRVPALGHLALLRHFEEGALVQQHAA